MEQAETIIRTLIVDDHPVVRYGVKHILDSEPDIEVVGELDGIDGIETTLDRLYPHVVLLDLEMGDIQGAEALRQLRDVAPNVHVIVYTSHDEEEYIIRAAELGVNGYLLKGSPKEEIVSAVRCVNEGGTAIESAVAAKLMQHMNKRSANARQPTVSFSKREKQVLKLLAAGKTNSNIGTALFISESTVKFHVHSILSKMGATNRTEAVSIATRQGVITLNADD
ncbi:MAG: response regulator transcription factor [Gammaproteobacteria bacterium]|nr:response regulator transcription factor [Gammaproteobacteria bacterium]MDH3749936.1 response regulator transcription factor [Gammaproteobacteria bacterium]